MDDKTSGTRKTFLIKPSNFKSEQNGSSLENGSTTSPSVNNPFLKCEIDKPEATKVEDESSEHEKVSVKQTTNNLFKPANLFAPSATSALSDNSSFVFGQNLHERVVMENINSGDHNEDTATNEGQLFSSTLSLAKTPEKESSNGESANMDGEALQTVPSLKEDEEKKSNTETISSTSLVEAARKYEEMRGAQKRKYDEVEITTGEEDERNILEINCKLFTFIENNYEERGRGILRLNDSKSKSHSRVVFRASGSLRLLLNTKVWRDQMCEQPSQKSLRLTAFDTNGVVKIYLVMGRNEDMSHLFRALSSRIRKEKDKTPEPEEAQAQQPAEPVKVTELEETDEPASKRSATCE